ncbi:TPA: DUF1310 family protein [Streptococcus suis]|uniref:DUF1310 family protein n=1 Tax=Streptococcus suis TaxID=1307 RepID=UPI00209C01E1|nr:DUF1310 family protein [Streptococcus suis]MCO8179295.1 DUF1310 domain-containing protein [Streptococcus suis]HEM2759625.1 DUF1310 family protein [Streptococcus suis]HEM3465718.1 DUF1310 family protein [Streptococcus suis]HEM3575540.1 DUF1310 family protein [Streptococcus suis]HEM3586428.1 DUF1310 family protein [Streptococcus suis]
MKKVMKIIIGILLVIVIGIGGIGYMQHKEHEKMVAIATSEEARKVYEDFMKKRDPNAFEEDGVIQSYEIDTTSLKYNPMGGLMVDVYLNGKQNIYISYNLIDNGDGIYHSAYYIGSSDLLEFLNEEYQ